MSEVELHTGKVWKVDISPLTVEEWCEQQCRERGIEKYSFHDSYKEAFLDEGVEDYVIVDDEIYQYDNTCRNDYDGIDYLNRNEDGSYFYITEFYNGGTCLSERLEEMIKNEKNSISNRSGN